MAHQGARVYPGFCHITSCFLSYFVDGAIEWDYYYARSALTDGDQFGIEETKVRNRTVQWRKF